MPAINEPTLRWANSEIPMHLDWSNCRDKDCFQLASLVMTGLTRLQWKDRTLVATPSLATEWKFTTPTVLEMKLRPNVKWSNGEMLTSQHIAWGIERAQRLKSPLAKQFLSEIKKVRADEPDRVVIELSRAQEQLPQVLSHPVTFPVFRKTAGSLPLVTLGPYQIESFQKGQSVVLVRNASFYGVAPQLERLELAVLEKDSTAESLFRDNEIDFWDEAVVARTAPSEANHVMNVPDTSTLILLINPKKIPDPFQRLAIFRSIDRTEPLQLFRWQHLVAPQILPLAADGSETDLPTFDPSIRKTIFPFRTVRWNLDRSPDPWHEEVGANVAAQLGKNLDVEVETSSSKSDWTLMLVEFTPQPNAKLLGLGPLLARLGETAKTANAAESLLMSKRLAFPLYRRVRTTLQRKSARFLTLSPQGLWEVQETKS